MLWGGRLEVAVDTLVLFESCYCCCYCCSLTELSRLLQARRRLACSNGIPHRSSTPFPENEGRDKERTREGGRQIWEQKSYKYLFFFYWLCRSVRALARKAVRFLCHFLFGRFLFFPLICRLEQSWTPCGGCKETYRNFWSCWPKLAVSREISKALLLLRVSQRTQQLTLTHTPISTWKTKDPKTKSGNREGGRKKKSDFTPLKRSLSSRWPVLHNIYMENRHRCNARDSESDLLPWWGLHLAARRRANHANHSGVCAS